MDSKEEAALQQGKKRKRTTPTRKSKRVPKDPTSEDLPHRDSKPTPSTKKKACLSQTVGQGNSGVQSNRTLLEILKMCSPADVLKSLNLVNRQWMETCSSNELSKELWNTFLEDLYIPFGRSIYPKATFAAYLRQQQTVVDVCKDHLDVLNKATEVWTPIILSEILQADSCSYAVLFDGSLYCCGGSSIHGVQISYSNRAYKITLDGQVSSLESMITGRDYHGIAAYGRKVFVFGGYVDNRELLTIEVYGKFSWSELPAKLNNGHIGFEPHMYKGLIYLCGSNIVEIFNPESLTIEILAEIKLPPCRVEVVTIYQGNLVIVGWSDVIKWNLDRHDSVKISKPQYLLKCCRKTVLYGDVLYVIMYGQRLMMDMKTFSLKAFKNLED